MDYSPLLGDDDDMLSKYYMGYSPLLDDYDDDGIAVIGRRFKQTL